MKKKEPVPKAVPDEKEKSFRIFSLRVLFSWMFLVFTGWMVMGLLPSQVTFTTGFFDIRPLFSPVYLKTTMVISEALFSTTLLGCIFIPNAKPVLVIHTLAALFFCFFTFAMKGKIYLPLTAYLLLLFSFYTRDEKKFAGSFEYMQTLVVVVILWYAANYFISWYHYLESTSYKTIINANPDAFSFDSRGIVAKNIMPWYYIVFLIFIPRIFTSRYNKFFLPAAGILVLLEFFLNVTLNPGITFLLLPFLNWQGLFRKSSRSLDQP